MEILRNGEQCRVSGQKEQCRVAHIVLVEEDEWFHANKMPGYVFEHQRRSRAAITNVKNLMHSPADPHASCDTAKMVVFIPKSRSKTFVIW